MYVLKFISYTNSGHVDAMFTDEMRAQNAYQSAVSMREAAIGEWSADASGMIPFEITDDFGIRMNVNLFACAILLTNTEASARMQRVLTDANEAAQAKHGKPAVGFGASTPGVPVV